MTASLLFDKLTLKTLEKINLKELKHEQKDILKAS
jgi:hypothetical protein